jgi:hypothetical protein
MQSEGIITVSEPKKGVETISNINHLHPKLENFRVIKYAENPSASEQVSVLISYVYHPTLIQCKPINVIIFESHILNDIDIVKQGFLNTCRKPNVNVIKSFACKTLIGVSFGKTIGLQYTV